MYRTVGYELCTYRTGLAIYVTPAYTTAEVHIGKKVVDEEKWENGKGKENMEAFFKKW